MAAESGLADAVSLSDVKALGRPKEFTGREEDFQEWSKKDGGILRWCDQRSLR